MSSQPATAAAASAAAAATTTPSTQVYTPYSTPLFVSPSAFLKDDDDDDFVRPADCDDIPKSPHLSPRPADAAAAAAAATVPKLDLNKVEWDCCLPVSPKRSSVVYTKERIDQQVRAVREFEHALHAESLKKAAELTYIKYVKTMIEPFLENLRAQARALARHPTLKFPDSQFPQEDLYCFLMDSFATAMHSMKFHESSMLTTIAPNKLRQFAYKAFICAADCVVGTRVTAIFQQVIHVWLQGNHKNIAPEQVVDNIYGLFMAVFAEVQEKIVRDEIFVKKQEQLQQKRR